MKKLIEIKDLTIEKDTYKLLQSLSLDIYEGVNTFICGTCGSGKTLLLKAIAGQVKYKGHIVKNAKIEVVFDKNEFINHTILEELNYEKLDDNQKKIVNKFISKSTLNKKINEVDIQNKKMVLICKSLINYPELLFVDNLFSYLNNKNLQKIYAYAKKNHITLVNVSTNIEDALNYDYMVVLNQGSVAIEGKTLQVLEQEKILKRLGIGLPFYVDLSIQLRLYGLIGHICLSKEELVCELWK